MKIIPILKVSNMKEAVSFYTRILDFELKYPEEAEDVVVDLIHGEAEIQLTSLPGDQMPGFNINVNVENVDGLFRKYIGRGLDISNKEGSPVHQGPLDQTWGMREFYVTDTDWNTLRFRQPIG